MQSRYFRYLFENLDEGVFHSGCIYDKSREQCTNYIYMSGNDRCTLKPRKVYRVNEEKETIPDVVDILIIGSYTVAYIKRLIYIVKNYQVKTAILPYLAPIQRLVLTEYMVEKDAYAKECVHYLQDPYAFLKKTGIENIYFLYDNDEGIDKEPEELAFGCHLEPADAEIQKLIREMEGYTLPVVKAGYIIENNWLFMFGVYGLDLRILSAFTREYFKQTESAQYTMNGDMHDYVQQMKVLIQEYMQKFGTAALATIVLFEAPVNASPRENDSFMVEKEFSRTERCKAWLKQKQENCCNCVIRCMHDKDHDIMQHHKNAQKDQPRFGMLLLGNLNLNKYFQDIYKRFHCVSTRIRGVVVPNGGSQKVWKADILDISSAQERIYWICVHHDITAPAVVNDIVLHSTNNRFLCVDKEMGICFSGYIVPKKEGCK